MFDVPILFVLTAASLIYISNLGNRIVFRPLRGVFLRPPALRDETHLKRMFLDGFSSPIEGVQV